MLKILSSRILMLLALFILVSYAAFSKPISLEEAREIAMQHNLQMNKYSIELQDPSAYKLIASSHDIFSNSIQNPTFYIYNFPQKGWVIVAGDDIARPILAYSKDASYSLENIPDNAKYWLEIYDNAISEAVKQGVSQSEKIANEWLMARNPKKRTSLLAEVVPPLIKTKWGQKAPYNDLCPYDEDAEKRTITGCVATTMAQIMKYWNFPVSGKGKHTYGHGLYGKLSADFENTTYDWDNMTNEYNQNSSKEEIKAVATLMYHCGVALSMHYGVEASGTDENYITSSLEICFMYDDNARMIHRYEYDDNNWTDMLKKNLDNNQPIAYAGETSKIRHSFICDGYDTDGRFHFNLGWNGNSNGFYYIDNITHLELNLKQNAIIDIKPVEEFRPQISLLKPLELKQEVVYQNSTVKINANIVNKKAESFSGSLSLRLFDAEDNFVITIAEQKVDNLEPNKPTEVAFETNPLFNTSAGKYYIKLYHKHDILNKWLISSGNNKLVLDIRKPLNTGSKLSLYSSVVISTYQIEKEKDSTLKATASFINTSKEDFKGIISASIYDEKGNMIKELASYNVTESIASNDYIKNIEFSNNISDLEHATIYFIGFRSKDENGEFALVNTNNFISFVKFEILPPGLVTDSRLKQWIKRNKDKIPGVVVNEDGGIAATTINSEALAKIEILDCSKSKLVSIYELIRHMPNLKTLICNNNSFIELDLSKNIKLKVLNCLENQLTNLDLSKNIKLEMLNCCYNHLNNLTLGKNVKLEKLYCSYNQLNKLDISKNIELTLLSFADNCLTNLDLSKNVKLEVLYCHKNQLSKLDVTNNVDLIYLHCYENKLTNLDISKNIKLEVLYCHKNQLSKLDVTNNVDLIYLHCYENKLSNLDISKNIKLEELRCYKNQLNKLDISKNIELMYLNCSENQLTNLDVNKNIKLLELYCSKNQLNKLDVTNIINIKRFDCRNNRLNNLDISENIELTYLNCSENQLTNLDVNKNIKLLGLYCSKNHLSNLDVSKNIRLIDLFCNDNTLNSLDISQLINLIRLNCCSQVKGFILYLTSGQKNRFANNNYCDATLLLVRFNELITDLQLKNWIKSNRNKLPGVIANKDGGIDSTTANLEALAKINSLDCRNFELISIDELIRHMPNLKILTCYNNSLINLDLSKNIELEELHCYNNQLNNLDLSNNIKLTSFICYNNQLTNLELSKNIILQGLYCFNNKLENLDLSNNIELMYLNCSYNELTNLDINKNIEITWLYCHNNQLNNLDLSKNMNIELLHCYNNQLNNLELNKNIELVELYCNDNILNSLDISPIPNLQYFNCCNQAESFILYLTNKQKSKFTEKNYCDAILQEKDGSICEIEWLDIYPNPTVGKFFIVNKFFTDEIKIFNVAGEVLYRTILNDEKTEIDISNLPAGVYFVITKGKIGKVVKN